MATETIIGSPLAVTALDAIVDAIDQGDAAGYVEIRSGTKPANVQTAPPDGAVLSTVTLNDPAFGAAAYDDPNNWAEADADVSPALTQASADGTGTASWFRVYSDDTGGEVAVIDGTCGTSDADMILNTTAIVAASPFSILSWQIRLPTGE